MEERVDVGVVNPERIGASMEQQILYRLLIYFFFGYIEIVMVSLHLYIGVS